MSRFLFAIIMCLALSTASASADRPPFAREPLPDDVVRTRACLSADEADRRLRACIGLVHAWCVSEQPEETALTNETQRNCYEREAAAWRGLADETGELIERAGSDNVRRLVERLRAEHREWMYTRCAFEASIYEGGSFARVVLAHCYRNAHAELAIALYWRAYATGESAWPPDPADPT